MDYSLLREKVERAGILSKSPLRYVPYFLGILVCIAFGLWVLTQIDNYLLLILDGVFLGLVFAQSAFLGHDIAHKQVFRSPFWQQIIGTFWFSALFGASMRWWTGKHDLHHAHPNELGMDPDAHIPFSFSPEHLATFTGMYRRIADHQRALFPIMLSLARASSWWSSIRDFFQKHDRTAVVEATLFVVHFALYFYFIFYFLPFTAGVFFVLLVFFVQSINLGLAFAPNHKGMPILPNGTSLDFITRQITTARNISPSMFMDFLYGGLNYQIEHHLFPTIPRHNLRRAREIVKEFCGAYHFTYHEVGPLQSLQEIYQSFYST